MGRFEKVLDRATNSILLEPDWESILLIVDLIRSGEVPAKPAVLAIRKKCFAENPHSALHALLVLESVVKNCGDKAVREIATKESMENLKELAVTGNEKVKEKVLELIQVWAHAFREKTEYKIIKDTHQLMKLEGFEFQPWREADALYASESAPDWVDADNCYRCRAAFGLMTRKHHCRNCGQIFCDKCSSRNATIPKFGIEKEVRVCETCYEKLRSKATAAASPPPLQPKEPTVGSMATSSPLPVTKTAGGKTEAELREEEEFQLALALSQSEQEEKERMRQGRSLPYSSSASSLPTNGLAYKGTLDSTATAVTSNLAKHGSDPELHGAEMEPELAKYLNRSYWEKRKHEQQKPAGGGILRNSPTPSAPVAESASKTGVNYDGVHVNGTDNPAVGKDSELLLQNGDSEDLTQFSSTLRSAIEVFKNRIKSNQARGRSILSDTTIQTQFMNLTTMHSQLLMHLQGLDEKRGKFERLQDKVVQIRDAREAVNALREEHEQKRQMEAAELNRQRQMIMMTKLEVMRQKKHEMLEQQRMLAMQRMLEQERELQYRKQLAAQQAMMFASNPPSMNPYGMYPPQPNMFPAVGGYGQFANAGPVPSMPYPPQHHQMINTSMPGGVNNPFQFQDLSRALPTPMPPPQVSAGAAPGYFTAGYDPASLMYQQQQISGMPSAAPPSYDQSIQQQHQIPPTGLSMAPHHQPQPHQHYQSPQQQQYVPQQPPASFAYHSQAQVNGSAAGYPSGVGAPLQQSQPQPMYYQQSSMSSYPQQQQQQPQQYNMAAGMPQSVASSEPGGQYHPQQQQPAMFNPNVMQQQQQTSLNVNAAASTCNPNPPPPVISEAQLIAFD